MSDKSYDLIIEVSEEFLNRTLVKSYNDDAIPKTFEGSYTLDLPKIMQDYRKIEYSLTLTEPLVIDALTKNTVQIKFGVDLNLVTRLTKQGTRVKGHIIAAPVYNRGKHLLELNVNHFQLDNLKILDAINLPLQLTDWIDDIIKDLLGNVEVLSNIPVSPIVGDITLPEMPEGRIYQIPLGIGNVEILNEDTLALGFDIFSEGEGSKTAFINLSRGNDIALTLSQSAVNKIINHWWKYTTHPKSEFLKGRMRIDKVDNLIDYISNFSVEAFPKLATLGFIEIDWDFIDVWLDYEGSISLGKPQVLLSEGYLEVDGNAIIDLTGYLRAELDVSLEFDTSGPIPDFLTPWRDDRVVKAGRRRIDLMRFDKRRAHVDLVDVDASVEIGPEKRMLVRIHGFDMDLGIDWRLPRRLNKALEKRIEREINTKFPIIPVSPSIISQQMEGTGLPFDIDVVKILHNRGELVVHSDIRYKE